MIWVHTNLLFVFFQYSQNPDLSDARYSKKAVILEDVGSYSLVQSNLEDNQKYFFRAVAQKFEYTYKQINRASERKDVMETILNTPDKRVKVLKSPYILDSMWGKESSLVFFNQGEVFDGNVEIVKGRNYNGYAIYCNIRITEDRYLYEIKLDFTEVNTLKFYDKITTVSSSHNALDLRIDGQHIYRNDTENDWEYKEVDVSEYEGIKPLQIYHPYRHYGGSSNLTFYITDFHLS